MIRRLKNWLRQVIWERLDLTWVLPSGVRVSIDCKSDWYIYNEIFVDGDYDVPILATLDGFKKTKEKVTILDLGANVGFFALRWLDLAKRNGAHPEVEGYFIEGAPDICDVLNNRLVSQSSDGFSAKCLNGLAGKKLGSALINRADAHFGNSVMGANTGRSDRVAFVDLDALCESWSRISLIKCDIEGSEQDFLQSFPQLLNKTDRMVIEFHKHVVNVGQCTQIIEQAGLRRMSVIKDREDFCVVYFERGKGASGEE